jgi:carbonic anhydrase/acetyltransferase-like protein (isoleucine patch superfamily)
MAVEPHMGVAPRIDPSAFVHEAATVIGDVVVGREASIWPGAVLRGDFGRIEVGARTSIQDGAVLHGAGEQTTIGDDCLIAHCAFVEEAVIESRCLVGIGARVLNGTVMRSGAVVAAGAVVTGGLEIPSGYRAQGVPAALVRSSAPGAEYIERGVRAYADKIREYRRERERRPQAVTDLPRLRPVEGHHQPSPFYLTSDMFGGLDFELAGVEISDLVGRPVADAHTHTFDEIYVLFSRAPGDATIEITAGDVVERLVSPGAFLVPAGTPHHFVTLAAAPGSFLFGILRGAPR